MALDSWPAKGKTGRQVSAVTTALTCEPQGTAPSGCGLCAHYSLAHGSSTLGVCKPHSLNPFTAAFPMGGTGNRLNNRKEGDTVPPPKWKALPLERESQRQGSCSGGKVPRAAAVVVATGTWQPQTRLHQITGGLGLLGVCSVGGYFSLSGLLVTLPIQPWGASAFPQSPTPGSFRPFNVFVAIPWSELSIWRYLAVAASG